MTRTFRKVRFSAYYNLATTNLLLGQVEEASKYFDGVKKTKKLLGMQYTILFNKTR
jgi:hypothetical protein